MAWLGWLLGVGLLLAMVGGSHVTGSFELTRARNRDRLQAEIRALFGLVKYRYLIPDNCYERLLALWLHNHKLQGREKRRMELRKRKRRVLMRSAGFHQWLRSTLKHVKCSRFRWVTRFGLPDPALTGTATGAVWGLQVSITAFLLRDVSVRTRPELAVVPRFQQAGFVMDLSVSARIRLWFAAGAVLLLGWRILTAKHGVRRWRFLLSRAR